MLDWTQHNIIWSHISRAEMLRMDNRCERIDNCSWRLLLCSHLVWWKNAMLVGMTFLVGRNAWKPIFWVLIDPSNIEQLQSCSFSEKSENLWENALRQSMRRPVQLILQCSRKSCYSYLRKVSWMVNIGWRLTSWLKQPIIEAVSMLVKTIFYGFN